MRLNDMATTGAGRGGILMPTSNTLEQVSGEIFWATSDSWFIMVTGLIVSQPGTMFAVFLLQYFF
jgi:hypothetical protein